METKINDKNYKVFKPFIKVKKELIQKKPTNIVQFKGMCPIVGTKFYILIRQDFIWSGAFSIKLEVERIFIYFANQILNNYFLYDHRSEFAFEHCYTKVKRSKTFISNKTGDLHDFPEITPQILTELRKFELRW